MQNNKHSKRKMLYILLAINVTLLLFIGVLAYRYSWIDKIPEKIGLKESPKPQDYLTTISWNHTMESLDYEVDVVFFGASLTSDGRWHEYFDTIKVCNLGKSGDRLKTMLWRVPQITAVRPKKIFLAMEQNDMHDLTIEEIEKAYYTLVDSIAQANPQAKLHLESLTPLNECQYRRVCDNRKIRKVNEMIARVAKDRNYPYIDIYCLYEENDEMPMTLSYDGQHLRPDAYGRWAEMIKPYIEK